jgi:hypothetical protein
MMRVMTATCLAATFAVGLAAQSSGTSGTAGTATTAVQDPQAGGGRGRGGPRTVTGCLRTGETAGSYMLTDVQGLGGGNRAGGGTGTTGAGTGTATGTGAQQGGPAVSLNLTVSPEATAVDLKPHVGHKIEVTGTVGGGRGRGGAGAGSTATATGTGTTTTGATGTATGTGASATGGTGTQGGGRGPRNMTVTSIRMISESCS